MVGHRKYYNHKNVSNMDNTRISTEKTCGGVYKSKRCKKGGWITDLLVKVPARNLGRVNSRDDIEAITLRGSVVPPVSELNLDALGVKKSVRSGPCLGNLYTSERLSENDFKRFGRLILDEKIYQGNDEVN